jgi:hypothetical protein
MKKLRYICVQPRILYYAWQVEVMINNFIKHGISGNDIDILVAYNPNDGTSTQESIDAWNKLANEYNYVRFFFYEDTRVSPIRYISSIRPNILKQHFQTFPELKDEVIFYHDCDIVFTKTPDFNNFLYDNIWYLSNTNSYINYDYIISKGQDVYDLMCKIIGIDPIIPRLMNSNSGGAQYILKNIDAEFWDKVEKDSEELYYQITQLNNQKKQEDPNYHELQIWCSDMWALLWNGWLRGNETKVIQELNFSWATDPISRWNETTIYHNAGVTCSCGRNFYKSNYMNSLPYDIKIEDYTQNNCNYNYVLEILETSQKSYLI